MKEHIPCPATPSRKSAAVRKNEVREAIQDILPATIAIVPIALLYGALAADKGMSVAEAFLMSLIVFAGGSQFAAIELWGNPLPFAAIVFSTLLINARHVLMGISIAPKLAMPRWQQYIAVYFMTDESWALAERRALLRPISAVYWFSIVAVLPTTWMVASIVGAALGPLFGPPERIGADFAFTALFIALIAGFERSRVMLTTVATSAVSAAAAYYLLGSPWHVMVGAVCGIAAAYLTASDGKGSHYAG